MRVLRIPFEAYPDIAEKVFLLGLKTSMGEEVDESHYISLVFDLVYDPKKL